MIKLTTLNIIEEIIISLQDIGLITFYKKEYPSWTHDTGLPPFTVGLISAYYPGLAAIFTITFRYSPTGVDYNQLFQFRITSQFEKCFPYKHILPPRILDMRDINRGFSYHTIPMVDCRWQSECVLNVSQNLTDSEAPIEDKMIYGADLFDEFILTHNNSLLPRFTKIVVPNVAPDFTAELQQFHAIRRRGPEQIKKYFWTKLVNELPKELGENPDFPLFR
jgi:hypothetical protein